MIRPVAVRRYPETDDTSPLVSRGDAADAGPPVLEPGRDARHCVACVPSAVAIGVSVALALRNAEKECAMTNMNAIMPGMRLVAATACALACASAQATDGDLDVSFGEVGIALAGDESNPLPPRPLVQPDGGIVLCASQGDVILTRFLAGGVVDSAFGIDGRAVIDFGTSNNDDRCLATALDAHGRILVQGAGADDRLTIARLTAGGTSDATFGAGTGRVVLETSPARAVAVLPDGRILVAGSQVGPGFGIDFVIARLQADGALDTGFNAGGYVSFDVGGNDFANALVVDADGRILVASSEGSVARLSPGGRLDAGFGENGRVQLLTSLGMYLRSMRLDRDGSILLAGLAGSGVNEDMALARLRQNGSPDSAFGNGGLVRVAFDVAANGSDVANDLALQDDGKIVLVGAASTSGTLPVAAAARLNADGSLDARFGVQGRATFALGVEPSVCPFFGVALQAGRIVASGTVRATATERKAMAVRLANDLMFRDGFE